MKTRTLGDEEGRSDDHVFWLQAGEAAREEERNQGNVTALPSRQQRNEKTICNAALHRCVLLTEVEEEWLSSSTL